MDDPTDLTKVKSRRRDVMLPFEQTSEMLRQSTCSKKTEIAVLKSPQDRKKVRVRNYITMKVLS
jgi:hypothetical protein